MLLLSALSLLLGGVTVVGLVVVGGSLVARPLTEILAPGSGPGVPAVLARAGLAWAFLSAVAGGFVAAWTAPRAPLRHALLLGLALAALGLLVRGPGAPGAVGGVPVLHAGLALAAPVLGGWLHGRLRSPAGERAEPEARSAPHANAGGSMRIEVDDGVALEVVQRGPTDADPVVLIHGFPLHHGMWSSQLAGLSDRHRMIAYDVRGLGKSDTGDGQYTMELYVDDLFRVLDALEPGPVVGCGLSMGGYVLLRALEREPGRFRGAVLADTRSAADDDEGRLGRAGAIRTLRERGADAYARAFLEGGALGATSRGGRPEVVEAVREMIRSNDPRGMIGAQLAMVTRTDTTAVLETLDLPLLVLVGEEDELTPPGVARDMAERAPRSRLSVIPDAGHLAPMENPEPFDRALRAFLEGGPES